MEKKELWPYHYSVSRRRMRLCVAIGADGIEPQALEPLPTLRKIWVNGDTRHNQIRRTASLGLRSNGVYQIYGTREKGDVEWKFEYVVEDRRSGATGKVISGERVRSIEDPRLNWPNTSTDTRTIDCYALDILLHARLSR